MEFNELQTAVRLSGARIETDGVEFWYARWDDGYQLSCTDDALLAFVAQKLIERVPALSIEVQQTSVAFTESDGTLVIWIRNENSWCWQCDLWMEDQELSDDLHTVENWFHTSSSEEGPFTAIIRAAVAALQRASK